MDARVDAISSMTTHPLSEGNALTMQLLAVLCMSATFTESVVLVRRHAVYLGLGSAGYRAVRGVIDDASRDGASIGVAKPFIFARVGASLSNDIQPSSRHNTSIWFIFEIHLICEARFEPDNESYDQLDLQNFTVMSSYPS
ncbi:hypothetical protein BDQ12DRAFT_70010 [Crucibulum laeve]|uniref:Uncharacterized protein n=1 Tax=Crucibulum laeve TaxID=68775 RepID=A0A5C3M1W9_9AGAR|nr:hypothetical protein BDQ12DRAFT_70010 [Crucibulum laeve]